MRISLLICLIFVSLVALSQAQRNRGFNGRNSLNRARGNRQFGGNRLFRGNGFNRRGNGFNRRGNGFIRRGNNFRNRFGRDTNTKQDSLELNSIKCQVIRNNSAIISCQSRYTFVECPVSVNMSVFRELKYDYFDLSRIQSLNYTDVEPTRHEYYMFPRKENDTQRLNISQPCVNGNEFRDIKLCYSDGCNGVRITDLDCFTDLTSFFSRAIHRLIVPVDGKQCDLFGFLRFD